MMRTAAQLTFMLGICCSTALYAQSSSQLSPHHIYISTELSWNAMQAYGDHQNMEYIGSIGKLGRFKVNGANATTQAGVSAGLVFNAQQTWFSSFRIGLQTLNALGNTQVKGLWTYTLHNPPNHYHYSYAVHTSGFGAQLMTDLYRKKHFAIFVGAGVGLDWLQSSGFKTVPIDSDKNEFRFLGASRRNVYFNLQLGCHYLVHHGAWGISYIYQDLGYVNSGKGLSGAGKPAPSVNDRLQASGVQISYTFFM